MVVRLVRWKVGGRMLSLVMLGGISLSSGAWALSPLASAQSLPDSSSSRLAYPRLCSTGSAFASMTTAPLAISVPGSATGHPRADCRGQWATTGRSYLLSTSLETALGEDTVGPILSLVPRAKVAKPASPASTPQTTHTSSVARTTAKTVTTTTYRPSSTSSSSAAYGSGPGAWTPVPGHPSYSLGDFAGDPYSGVYGTCTWYAWYRHQNEPLLQLGNAWQWAGTARAHGLSTGTTPVVGATAVFQPGVQGAGGGGHTGHVEQVLANGWFVISEMNFYWNGGGFGRVDYRYAHVGAGISFIY